MSVRSARAGVLVIALLGALVLPASASAMTFPVTSALQAGPGSLAAAISAANANPGADTITFAIGTGPRTINVWDPAAWPAVTGPVTIDGTTQPGYAGTPIVKLIGCSDAVCTLTGSAAPGVRIAAGGDGSVIRGLIVSRFNQGGIVVEAPNVKVAGNYVGVDFNGVSPGIGNASSGGVRVVASNVTVGGTTAADRNVISDNHDGCGVNVAAGAGSRIQGNYIGTDRTGLNGLANIETCGVRVTGTADQTQVGGTAPGAGNVLSGNDADGVEISGGTGTLVQGNRIGVGPDGTTIVANRHAGVRITGGTGTVIGGASSAAANVISGNEHGGVRLLGATATIQGNLIGLASTGTSIRANGDEGIKAESGSGLSVLGNFISGNTGPGVWLTSGATGATVRGNLIGVDGEGTPQRNTGDGVWLQGTGGGNVVGGRTPGDRNVIAGNDGAGVHLDGGADRVEGNVIGLAADRLTPTGNQWGVLVTGTGATVGGTAPGAGNLISGNDDAGVRLDTGATGAVVQGNQVGGDGTHGFGAPDGFLAANAGAQIQVAGTAAGNLIGGGTAGAGNDVIEVNPSSGAIRLSGSGVGNTVRANRIRLNGSATGIDRGPLGITPALTPTLTSILVAGTRSQVMGTFTGAPSAFYAVDVYAAAGCSDLHRAATRFLGTGLAATGADGAGTINLPLDAVPAANERLIATLTDTAGTTNEFGPCAPVAGVAPVLQLSSAAYTGTTTGGVVRVTVTRTGGGDASAGVRLRSADGTAHAGTDFTAVDAYVTVNAGQPSATFDIPVTALPKRAYGEPRNADRSFTLIATAPNAAILGAQDRATVTLTDDRPDGLNPNKPVVTVLGPGLRSSARGLKMVRGTATQQPTKVEVAVTRISGCRHVKAGGRLERRRHRRCTAAWLPATGTDSWRLLLPHRLPRGSYWIFVRATNVAGTGATVKRILRLS